MPRRRPIRSVRPTAHVPAQPAGAPRHAPHTAADGTAPQLIARGRQTGGAVGHQGSIDMSETRRSCLGLS
jgi:hypothetical protein